MSEILNFLKRIQLGIAGLQNTILHHHTRHEAGGSDEIATETGVHHSTHENTGADEINVAELSGELADQQKPKAHSLASHSTKAHSELTGVTSDQHHPQAHTLASHSTKAHSELTGVTSSQHHNRGKLIESFTAGENLNANEGVYLSAANTVSKATNANATKAIGVTIEAVSSGNPVDVCIAGKATAIANEAISVGDLLTPSVVAGRLAILTTNTNSTGSHTHTQGVTGSNGNHYHTQGETGTADINHRHGIETSSVATGAGLAHSHKYDKSATATGTPSATQLAVTELEFGVCPLDHPTCAMTKKVISLVAHKSHTHGISLSNVNSGSESSHTHNYDKVSSVTNYVNPSHAHTNPNTNTTGAHTHTNPSTESAGSHDHTTNIGKVLAKAITAASNPGDTFSIIVCLGA